MMDAVKLILVVIAICVVMFISAFTFVPTGIDGEYQEGIIYGKLQNFKVEESSGFCGSYGYTEIKLEGHERLRYTFAVDYVNELEVGKVYGFYYKSYEMGYSTTRNFGEPTSYWTTCLDKIVDCENNVLWKSTYGEMPGWCWTIIFVIVIILVLICLLVYGIERRKQSKEEEKK